MLDAAPPPATSPETPTFEADSLPRALERTFGFASFRPYQEEIIRDALAGRDVLAVLPTGGGKSLCFQLPAVLRQGLTLVVSPLIALMKDQVDSLTAAGIPATFLSSTLEADESRARLKNLRRGEYRLLYVAPERLLLPGFHASLSAMDIRLLAVDEAHCISQWGHDFRPEYRRIADLRDLFPKAPVMALSATATERVRADITASLRLVEPRSYIASFDRPNILYRVEPKESAFEKLLALLASHEGESGILYAHSRKSVEALAARLRREHINAAPYHAGMDPESRAATQEAFARDDIRIICATVAFGMGIHKPDVRFVVHHDLPGDIESYYQETGRAGRDGLPSEALLFWNPADALKQRHFIDQKPDLDDRAGARRRLAEMLSFAESGACRRRSLLAYFGEHRDDTPCNACDNCLSPREQYDATVDAQKLLSCVLRIQQRSHLSVGLTHIIAVLLGADTEKIRRLGHADLSTYGIGADKPRAEWSAIARELLRQGLLRVTGDKYAVIEVTPEGLTTLKTRTPVTLTRPLSPPRTQRRKDDLRPPPDSPSPLDHRAAPDMDTAPLRRPPQAPQIHRRRPRPPRLHHLRRPLPPPDGHSPPHRSRLLPPHPRSRRKAPDGSRPHLPRRHPVPHRRPRGEGRGIHTGIKPGIHRRPHTGLYTAIRISAFRRLPSSRRRRGRRHDQARAGVSCGVREAVHGGQRQPRSHSCSLARRASWPSLFSPAPPAVQPARPPVCLAGVMIGSLRIARAPRKGQRTLAAAPPSHGRRHAPRTPRALDTPTMPARHCASLRDRSPAPRSHRRVARGPVASRESAQRPCPGTSHGRVGGRPRCSDRATLRWCNKAS
ncbi:MAG: DNA helicase RecQ [Polyangiaceae bacterium]